MQILLNFLAVAVNAIIFFVQGNPISAFCAGVSCGLAIGLWVNKNEH